MGCQPVTIVAPPIMLEALNSRLSRCRSVLDPMLVYLLKLSSIHPRGGGGFTQIGSRIGSNDTKIEMIVLMAITYGY